MANPEQAGMTHDRFSSMRDAPLFIVPRVLDALRAYQAAPAFNGSAGSGTAQERARLETALDGLLERLLIGIERHPTKFFVMKQFQQSLDGLEHADTQAREQFGMALGDIMDILGIDDSDGVLSL